MNEKQEGFQDAEFKDLKEEKAAFTSRDIEFLLDIPVDITVELGMTKMPIKELLQLGQGSVVELTKLAGEPMEVLANNRLIARGEVVVVNEKFGIRLTDIISPTERLTQLK
ncbi:MAG: flagellar motor switch protein FliN [Nitrospirae bacterium]|nr:flagellar motor switch protein FliN [Nitrospirota bacterium]